MLRYYKTLNGRAVEIEDYAENCWVRMVAPTEDEIKHVCSMLQIPETFVRSSLDEEERSRIDEEDGCTLIIVDTPTAEKVGVELEYSTIPFGIIVTSKSVVTVCIKNTALPTQILDGTVKNIKTAKIRRFVLQLLFQNATLFLYYLRRTEKEISNTEKSLRNNMRNKELIRLLHLDKGLVYFSTGLKGDQAVLEKLARMRFISAYPEDAELLEDVIVENRQAVEMCQIYRDILSGTMNGYSSVISNNLNTVMKLLAAVTIILTIPQLVFSLWGINTPVPFEHTAWGFWVVLAIAVVLTGGSFAFAIYKKWLKK